MAGLICLKILVQSGLRARESRGAEKQKAGRLDSSDHLWQRRQRRLAAKEVLPRAEEHGASSNLTYGMKSRKTCNTPSQPGGDKRTTSGYNGGSTNNINRNINNTVFLSLFPSSSLSSSHRYRRTKVILVQSSQVKSVTFISGSVIHLDSFPFVGRWSFLLFFLLPSPCRFLRSLSSSRLVFSFATRHPASH